MRLGKPARQLVSIAVATAVQCAGTVALLGVAAPPVAFAGAMLVWFVAWLLASAVVNDLEMRLRERTRDPWWLWSGNGRAWLATDEGRAWLATPAGEAWLATADGARWRRGDG